MVSELVIVRHGEAAEGEPGELDGERPLTPRGQEMAVQVGRWLAASGVDADRVIASPAVRSRETTRHLVLGIGYPFSKVRWVDSVYGASVQALLQIVRDQGRGARRVVLVGHNPGLEDLAGRLVGRGEAPKRLPPGGALRLQVAGEDLVPGCCTLEGAFWPGPKGD